MFQLKDSRIVAGIDVVQRDKDPPEPIVSGRVRCQACRVVGTAWLAIGASVLKFVLKAIKGISRNESVDVNGSNQFPAAASLISQCRNQMPDRFVLSLKVIRIHIRSAGVRKRSE